MPPGTHMMSPPRCWSSKAKNPNARAPSATYHGDGANVSSAPNALVWSMVVISDTMEVPVRFLAPPPTTVHQLARAEPKKAPVLQDMRERIQQRRSEAYRQMP
jgi:hypothetical protein